MEVAQDMLAVVCKGSGGPDKIYIERRPIPIPGEDEMLLRVHASSVTRGDVKLRRIPRAILVPLGLLLGFKPMDITGVEYAGEVLRVGAGVRRFRVGDRVFGTASGLRHGGNAEYLCVPEQWKQGVVTHIPDGVDYEHAAVLPVGAMTAAYLLDKVTLSEGSSVLIHGASGSVGMYTLQLARHRGARVTAVCGTANAELLRSLGADSVLDYTREDFRVGGTRYDVVVDAVGTLSKRSCRAALTSGGSFLSVRYPTKESLETLDALALLLRDGVITPFIDRIYTLDQLREAHRYVESGRKRGNVLVRCTAEATA